MEDPRRSGAGRGVIDLLAAAEVSVGVVHIGCEAASFARAAGLYRSHGYAVVEIRVFDSFTLTHHTESVTLLTRRPAGGSANSRRSNAPTGNRRR